MHVVLNQVVNVLSFLLVCLQLLGAVIQHEKPELEVQKSQLLKQEEELKIELAKLEEALLEVRGSFLFTHIHTHTHTRAKKNHISSFLSRQKFLFFIIK